MMIVLLRRSRSNIRVKSQEGSNLEGFVSSKTVRWVGLVMVSAVLVGCESRLTGERAELVFAYDAHEDVENFNKPIALGAQIELRVTEVGTDDHVEVTKVETSEHLEYIDSAANLFALKATKPGAARVSVLAESDYDGPRRDSVTMRVEPIDSVRFEHVCSDSSSAVYLAGSSDVEVAWYRRTARGEPLIGGGVYPVAVEPAGAIVLREDDEDQSYLHFELPRAVEHVKIYSPTLEHEPIFMKVIDSNSVDRIAIDEFDDDLVLFEDGWDYAHFYPIHQGEAVCEATLRIDAKSLTPDICDVRPGFPDEPEAALEGVVSITGKKMGVCRYEAWYPGTRARDEFQARVGRIEVPAPRDGQYADAPGDATPPSWYAPLLAMLASLLAVLSMILVTLIKRKR